MSLLQDSNKKKERAEAILQQVSYESLVEYRNAIQIIATKYRNIYNGLKELDVQDTLSVIEEILLEKKPAGNDSGNKEPAEKKPE